MHICPTISDLAITHYPKVHLLTLTYIYAESSPPSKLSSPPAVLVTVDVVVAVFVALLVAVLVTVVSPGPRVMRQEQAEEISLGLPRPSEMLTPGESPSVMPIWRLRTGSSLGQVTS